MGCASTVAGCILVTLNTIFLLIAIAIGGIGGFIKWGTVTLLSTPVENFIGSAVGDKVSKKEVKEFIKEIFMYLGDYGLILFIIGVVLAVVTLLAIFGVCCQSKCLLMTYAVIVFIFLAGMGAATVLLFVKKDYVRDKGGEALKGFIDKTYQAANYFNPKTPQDMYVGVSGVLDIIQQTAECCGITNYTDFKDAKKWTDKSFVYDHGTMNITILNLTIPPSCCVLDKLESCGDKTKACCLRPGGANKNNSFIDDACYSKLWDQVDNYWDYVKYTFIGLTAFLLILFISTLCAMRFEKEKIDPI